MVGERGVHIPPAVNEDSDRSAGSPSSLDAEDWEGRWRIADTPWDLGGVTPALVDWCRRHELRGQRVLVPGCGTGHDAHFLSKRGAEVVGLDHAESALAAARAAHPATRVSWQSGDVRAMRFERGFDRVWEYTCFCALAPDSRRDYLRRVRASLHAGGVYWGMVFSSVPRPESGPPFQIGPGPFQRLLATFFEVVEFERQTPRSVKPRRGTEIWFATRKA